MSAQPLEIRMARLEGAYEQIADRLHSIEQTMDSRFAQGDARLTQLEQKIDVRFAQSDTRLMQLEQKIDSNLRTVITWMLGQTAVILGSVAAFAFHR